MTLTAFQKKIAGITVIIGGLSAIGGSTYGIYSWIDGKLETIVTKDYLVTKLDEIKKSQSIATVELSLRMIDESLARYHTIGLESLTDSQRHRYDKLILAEQANENQRSELLGL